MAKLTVVLADDNELIRKGVTALLEAARDVEVVAECADAEDVLRVVDESCPSVVITDIRMPPTHSDEGIRLALELRAAHPALGVVVLSQFDDPAYVVTLFERGSERLGYLLKERVDSDSLLRAVRSVASGGSSVDARIIDVLVEARTGTGTGIERLTPREREVLARIAEGLNNAGVAEALTISERAVARHINSIFTKLDLGESEIGHRRVMAVLRWLAD